MRLEALTETVDDVPRHGDVAVGDVRVDTLGFALTVNVEVLPDVIVVEQPLLFVNPFMISVLLEPVTVSEDAGIVNVPLVVPLVKMAVAPLVAFIPTIL